MTRKQIADLLKAWSAAVLRCEDLRGQLSEEAVANQWVGEAPASAEAIVAAEARIGRKLPREYRAFLEISNGWRFFDDNRHLLPVERVDLLTRLDPELVEAYTGPLSAAGVEADVEGVLPASHYPALVRISVDDDGFYLLDPLDRVPGGWAARFFAHWLPGAGEATSFGELLQTRYEAFVSARGLAEARAAPRKRKLNLKQPPRQSCTDPETFVRVLSDLGFFDRTPLAVTTSMQEAFVKACGRATSDPNPAVRYQTSPMRELMRLETGRLCWLETEGLVVGGVAYAVDQIRPILAARGVELPAVEETRGELRWEVRLGNAEATVCRMRKGRPLGAGLDLMENVAQAVLNTASRVLNRHLRDSGSEHRVANVDDLQTTDGWDTTVKQGLLVLTDEQSYELMWCALGGSDCQVIRADVF